MHGIHLLGGILGLIYLAGRSRRWVGARGKEADANGRCRTLLAFHGRCLIWLFLLLASLEVRH